MIAVGRRRLLAPGLGVDVLGALNLIGTLVKYLSLTLAVPVVVALIYSETVWPFVWAGLIGASFGWTLERLTRGREQVGMREGFLVVSLTWVFAAGLGALPYLLADEPQLAHPLDAYFEAMSGFTTTGSTVLTDIEGISRSVAMWRQLTQWLGGMGIIVLFLAVLPRLRVGGRQLLEQELPGPEIEHLKTRIRDTARRLWLLYIALTVTMVGTLAVFGWTGLDRTMDLYQALAHSLTTLPTGGFSTQSRSIETFGAASQWVIVFFMVLAGANFALLYRAFVRRQPRSMARDEEFRLYASLLLAASALLLVELLSEGLFAGEAAVRHAVFQAVSVMTSTGYATADFNDWTLLASVILIALMFFGGSAGSTGGSVKVVRHLLLGRILRRELDQTVHPELVSRVRLNGAAVDERALRAIASFVLLYVGLFALGTLLLFMDAAWSGADVRFLEAVSASAAALGNIGPSFGFAGPMGSYDPFGSSSKVILILLMWIGRLEIVPVAVLMTRAYWRA